MKRTIEQWLVSVGDHVDEYEPLCEVITDKVTAEVRFNNFWNNNRISG